MAIRPDQILDGFGRVVETPGPDLEGNQVALTKHTWVSDESGIYVETQRLVDWDNQSWVSRKSYRDGLERTYQVISQRPSADEPIITQKVYLTPTLVAKASMPYYEGDTPQWSTIAYDAYGRRIKMTTPYQDPKGTVTTTETQWKYAHRNTITRVDAFGTPEASTKVMTFHYFNGKRRTTQMVVPNDNNATTVYEYDLLGRLTNVKDPNGVQTSIVYDSLGRRTRLSEDNIGTTAFYYNKQGRFDHQSDAKGQTTTFTYDNLGRKLTKDTADNRISYAYDVAADPTYANAQGRLTMVKFGRRAESANYTYGYDRYGRLSKRDLSLDGKTYTYSVTYSPAGQQKTFTYPDNSVLTHKYTSTGYLDTITLSEPGSEKPQTYATYQNYTALGSPTSVQYGNGVTADFAYGHLGELETHTLTDEQGTQLLHDQFERDGLYQITGIRDMKYAGNGGKGQTNYSQTFTYQNRRLIEAEAEGTYGTLTYGYDEAGNITSKDGISYDYTGHQITAGTDNNTESTVFSASYDLNGNMTAKTTVVNDTTTKWGYEYDAENRMTQVQKNNAIVDKFTYDHRGRRLIKASADGTTTLYIPRNYEVTMGNGKEQQHTKYVFGPAGRIAAVTTPTSGPSSVTYFHKNQVNSTTVTTDGQGKLKSRVIYKPYGEIYKLMGKDDFRPKFGGKELDAGTGLYYFNARYYDPQIARFVTADSRLGAGRFTPDALNRYAYTLNDPVNYTDPTGRFALGHGCAIATAVSIGSGVGFHYSTETWQTGLAGAGLISVPIGLPVCLVALKNKLLRGNQGVQDADDDDLVRNYENVVGPDNGQGNGNGCGSPCFTAETKVAVSEGFRRIKNIKVGDAVWAYNEQTGQKALKPVVRVFRRKSPSLIVLTVGDQVIETTPEHPFWVEGKGWTPAKDLQGVKSLLSLRGERLAVKNWKRLEGGVRAV